MKVFIASLILLGILLLCIGVNYIYINEVFGKMTVLLEEVPEIGSEGCVDAAARLLAYWEPRADIVCLSVPYNAVDRVSEQAALLLSCAECGDIYGFCNARTLLRDAISDMRRLEAFTLGNLL